MIPAANIPATPYLTWNRDETGVLEVKGHLTKLAAVRRFNKLTGPTHGWAEITPDARKYGMFA